MALLLIPITYWNLFVGISQRDGKMHDFIGTRAAAILSGLIVIGWAWAAAVILSLGGHLDWMTISVWWIIGCAASFLLARNRGRLAVQHLWGDLRKMCLGLVWTEGIGVVVIFMVLMAAGIMGICSPPNNNDSMIYHLPRQILWMSAKSVFLHDAPNEFMLKWPPLIEYLGVNLWLLGDTDRFHNLVQFFALCGCLLLLGMILQSLGGGRKSSIYAALFAVTVPAVFYQASNTKNDILVAFFLLCILWVTECCSRKKRISVTMGTVLGFCIAAALMTKGTSIIYLIVLFPFALWRVLSSKATGLIRTALLSLGITLLLIAPHYLNQGKKIAEGDLSGKREHANESITVTNTLSVLSRNIALQMALPWEQANRVTEGCVCEIHQWLGRDENSSVTTYNKMPFQVIYWPNSEDNVTSVLHFLCLLFTPLLALAFIRALRERSALSYCFLPILLLLVFSAIFKWQPWHTRLLIPAEIIAAIPFGLLLSFISHSLLELFFIGSFSVWLFPCLSGWHRPLLGAQGVYAMDDLSQRTMKVPSSALDSIAIAELLSHLRPSAIQLNDSFYTPLVSMRRIHREWPEIKAITQDPTPCDILLRSLAEGAVSPPSRVGMRRAFESSHVCVDLSDKLYEEAKSYPPPAFTGLGNLKGLDEPVGPFPKYRQPIFCNAHYPSVSFQLFPEREKRFLKIEMSLPYWSDLGKSSCSILVNGHPQSSFAMTQRGKSYATTIPIFPSDDPVKIEIDFESGDTKTDSQITASVTSITVMPVSR